MNLALNDKKRKGLLVQMYKYICMYIVHGAAAERNELASNRLFRAGNEEAWTVFKTASGRIRVVSNEWIDRQAGRQAS